MVIYCQTTGVSAAHATHCATYCTPCRPLIRAFSGWIRTPPPTAKGVINDGNVGLNDHYINKVTTLRANARSMAFMREKYHAEVSAAAKTGEPSSSRNKLCSKTIPMTAAIVIESISLCFFRFCPRSVHVALGSQEVQYRGTLMMGAVQGYLAHSPPRTLYVQWGTFL